jgi:hypothetical protein
MTEAERAGHASGFVGYDKAGRFIHYCHCGKWGSFGVGVALNKDQLGTWFCPEHKPAPAILPPPPALEPAPPALPVQGSLF